MACSHRRRRPHKTVLSRPRPQCEQAITLIGFLLLGSPTQSSVDLAFTEILSSYYSVFVSCRPRSRNGTQLNRLLCLEVSPIWKCVFKIWGVPPLKNRGPPIFDVYRQMTLQLKANFNSQYLRNETLYKQSGHGVGNYTWSPAPSRNFKIDPKRLIIGHSFYPPSVNSAFLLTGWRFVVWTMLCYRHCLAWTIMNF